MGCEGNMPSFKYVTIDNLVITYNGTPYPIKTLATNKKYIVWNIDKPYQLKDTNVRPEESLLEYLIVINDNGKPTIVNHDGLLYLFDQKTNGSNLVGSSEYNVLKNEVKDNTDKFNLLSKTVGGVTQLIGETEELEDGSIIYNLNKIKTDSESYSVNIGEIKTKIDYVYLDIKPIVLNDLIEYLRSISEYKLSFTDIQEDVDITSDELGLITTNKININDKLNKLQYTLSSLKSITDELGDAKKSELITNSKNELTILHNKLLSICESAILNNKISGEEKSNIIQSIYELTTYVGIIQNTCNNIMAKGNNSIIYSVENELLMLKDNTINKITELNKKNEVLTEKYSKIEQTSDKISQIVGEVKSQVDDIDSSLNLTSSTYAVAFDLTNNPKNSEDIKLTATKIKLTGDVEWFVVPSTVKLSGEGDIRTISPNEFKNVDKIIVTARLGTAIDTTIISKIKDGSNGTDGATYYTWIKYSDNANGNPCYSTPTSSTQYIGIGMNKATETASTDYTQYTWSKLKGDQGVKGDQGIPGTDGVSASHIVVTGEQIFKYSNNFTGNPNPTSITLTATKINTNASGKWQYKNSSGSWVDWIENSSIVTATTLVVSPTSNLLSTERQMSIRYIVGSIFDEFTIVKVSDGATGATGSTGASGKDAYTIILSNESHSFAGSTTSALASSTKCEVIAYKGTSRIAATIGTITGLPTGMTAPITSNGTTSVYFSPTVTTSMSTKNGILTIPITVDNQSFTKYFSYSISLKGVDGNGVSSIVEYYLVATLSSGVTTSTSGWSTTIPTMTSTNKYLWNYEVINYTNSSPTISIPKVIGVYGATGDTGVGISSITNYYLASPNTTGVTTSTSGWTSTVQSMTSTNKYLWNYEVVKYTNGNSYTSTPTVIGTVGNDGKTSYFHIKYSSVASPTTSSQMTETPSTYIGTYVDYIEEDSNDPTKYTWSRFEGSQGDKGEQGIPGTNGDTGQTSYLHIKYSNDGGVTFTANNGETVGTYIGQYVDFTEVDSTSVSSYKWSKIKGNDGLDGSDGVSVQEVIIQYAKGTSATIAPTSDWGTTMPTYEKDYYLWVRTRVKYSDSTDYEYSNPVCDQSWKVNTQVYSEVVQLKDSIASKVSTSDMNSVITQTSENLIAKFSESGDYNLLRNSAGVQNTNQWNTWNTTSFISYVDDNIKKQTSSKKSFRIGNNSTTENYAASPRIRVQTNKTYAISGKYYVGSNCNGAEVYWLESDTVDEEGYTSNVTFDTAITLAYDTNYSDGTWKSFSKTITTSSSAKSALIRLDNNGSKTTSENFTYYSDLTVVEGILPREWSPHPSEVYDGIIALDRDGIVVEMIDGEGSKGSSKMSYEGIATYDQYGNTKSWFSDDNAYIKELNVDVINNPYLIQCKPRATNWYVGQYSTGDGTGRNTSNKSNSINSILEYIKNTAGRYIHRQDINIYCDSGVNMNEDIYIGGWIGSGMILINFGANSSYTGHIRVEECTPFVYLVGGGTWGVNTGCMWYRNNNGSQGSALSVRNSNVYCYGFRTHSNTSTYSYPFLFAHNGSKVMLYGMDFVKYWAICHCFMGADVYIDMCRGDIGILCEKMQNSTLVARSSLPLFDTGKDINNYWNSTSTIDGAGDSNSLWYPKSIPSEPDLPTPDPPSQSWQWIEKTFYFNLSSTTEGSGSMTSSWNGKWGQGKWGSYKPHRGHAVPTESISSWIGSNSRNVSMVLTMTRLSTNHGQYGAIPVPKLLQKDGSYWNSGVAFALGNTKSITLSSGVVSGLSDGSLSELTMWAGTSTNDYSQYNGVSLKVTCEKYY